MSKKTTVTEKFDENGKLIERVTVTEDTGSGYSWPDIIGTGGPLKGVGQTWTTNGCPCRVENGGSGICNCVLNGPVVTNSISPPFSSTTASTICPKVSAGSAFAASSTTIAPRQPR